jgi:hypothetical protein
VPHARPGAGSGLCLRQLVIHVHLWIVGETVISGPDQARSPGPSEQARAGEAG